MPVSPYRYAGKVLAQAQGQWNPQKQNMGMLELERRLLQRVFLIIISRERKRVLLASRRTDKVFLNGKSLFSYPISKVFVFLTLSLKIVIP